jgi:hypothetical protein
VSELKEHSLTVPAFRKTPELTLPLTATREGEARIIEAKTVSPVSYADLENCYSAAYRELKSALATLGFQKDQAQKAIDEAKSEFLIDHYYGEILKDKPKSHDSADLRNAHLMRFEPYVEALDRYNMVKAMEALVDGKIKVFERVSAYMKKSMDLIIRGGLADKGLWKK